MSTAVTLGAAMGGLATVVSFAWWLVAKLVGALNKLEAERSRRTEAEAKSKELARSAGRWQELAERRAEKLKEVSARARELQKDLNVSPSDL